jgi:hypothetical protein
MNNIEQYRKRFFMLMESSMGDVKPLILETSLDLNTATIYWMSCGGDEVELTPDSKKLLLPGKVINNTQYYYFDSEPNDAIGEYKIMECLGPEIGKQDDLYIDGDSGKLFLTKNY